MTVNARHHSTGAIALRAVLCAFTLAPLLRGAVVYHSVPASKPWRCACPQCAVPLGLRGDLHGLSPLARCGNCQRRIGPPHWTLEATAAASVAALIWSGLAGLPLVAYLWWAAIGLVLAFVDLAVQRLPARLTYLATGGLLVLLAVQAQRTHSWHPWVRSVLGALLTAAIVASCALVLPRLVHWGDVRYALAVGAASGWAGWSALYTAAVLATLSAALVGLGLVASGRANLTSHLPQGPFWYAGTLLALLLHRGSWML